MASHYENHSLNPQRDDHYARTHHSIGAHGSPPTDSRHGDPMPLVPPQGPVENPSADEIQHDSPPASTAGYTLGHDNVYGDPYGSSSAQVMQGHQYHGRDHFAYDGRVPLTEQGRRRRRSHGGRDRHNDDYYHPHTDDYPSSERHKHHSK
jgi:hypothetical protein